MANIHQEQHSIINMQVLTLLTCVRPIKVRILNRFLRVLNHRLPTVLIKKKLKKINLRVRFLQLKIVFFSRFLKIVIFYFLNHTEFTKSEISPQRKLGSLRILKLELIK